MAVLKTTEQFIIDAKEVHNNFYSYNNTDYKGAKIKVIITCPKHGDFIQNPSNHLWGKGCRECQKEKASIRITSNTETFIEKANLKHNFFYDYSLSDYVSAKDKIIITCKEHGNFEQTPNSHLDGQGCPICATGKRQFALRIGLDKFIKESEQIHNFKYDYSHADYTNCETPIKIICPIHGVFHQHPKNHMLGMGCSKCSDILRGYDKRSNTQEFIEKAILVHGNRYDYSESDYIKNKNKIVIICKEHGIFHQTPDSHLQGRGCKKCNLPNGWGFKRGRFVELYPNGSILYINELYKNNEVFIKVGITGTSIKQRFESVPYNYKILHKIFTNTDDVWEIEQILKKKLKQFRYKPEIDFGGKTECYTQEALPEIRNYLFNF